MGKKWDDARPAEKIVSLYSLLLFSGRRWSLKELAAKLNSSKASVLRLIDQLEGARYGKILKTKEGRESFYEIDRPAGLPRISLNADGLQQLAMCRDFILHLLPDSFQKTINATLTQASAFVVPTDDEDGVGSFSFSRSQGKGHIDYTPFKDYYQSIILAIRKKKICLVNYQSTLAGPERSFEYAPKRLTAYHESIRINGWMVDDKNKPVYETPTNLSLQRLKSVTLTERSARHLPEPAENDDEYFGLMNMEAPFEAVIKFQPETALYVAERQWSKRQEVVIHGDGSITLTLRAKSRPELMRWLLGFGSQAEILSPADLRRELLEEALALARLYEGTKDER